MDGRRGDRPRAADDALIAVVVLKGSVFFLANPLMRLRVPVAVDFLQTASYGAGGEHPGEVRIRKDLDLSIRGRDVLLVEDIVDTGFTVRTILDLLRYRGARSVRLCALLDKTAGRQVEVPIDYRGFAIENVFVVGYGLDHGERYRNLPYIAVWQGGGAPRAPPAPPPPPTGRAGPRKEHVRHAIPPHRPGAGGDRPLLAGGLRRRLAVHLRPGGLGPRDRRAGRRRLRGPGPAGAREPPPGAGQRRLRLLGRGEGDGLRRRPRRLPAPQRPLRRSHGRAPAGPLHGPGGGPSPRRPGRDRPGGPVEARGRLGRAPSPAGPRGGSLVIDRLSASRPQVLGQQLADEGRLAATGRLGHDAPGERVQGRDHGPGAPAAGRGDVGGRCV